MVDRCAAARARSRRGTNTERARTRSVHEHRSCTDAAARSRCRFPRTRCQHEPRLDPLTGSGGSASDGMEMKQCRSRWSSIGADSRASDHSAFRAPRGCSFSTRRGDVCDRTAGRARVVDTRSCRWCGKAARSRSLGRQRVRERRSLVARSRRSAGGGFDAAPPARRRRSALGSVRLRRRSAGRARSCSSQASRSR